MATTLSTSKSTSKRVAIVTGGNKGIGLEICRQLACTKDMIVVLTSRDEKRGNEALNNLESSGLSNIIFHQLDVTDSASIVSLVDYINIQFGKLDILVNNAGITGVIVDEESFPSLQLQGNDHIVSSNSQMEQKVAKQTYETAEMCTRTNYYGPKKLSEALIPLLLKSNSGRIINISSKLGQLKEFSNGWELKISDGDELTAERVEEFVNCFLKDAKEDSLEKNGWPNILSAYKVSKAALNAHTRILAKKFPFLCINAITPGFVKTDMSFYKGNISVEEGAKGPLMLALMTKGGPSGRFFIRTEESNF